MNLTIIVGNLTRDPELRTTNSGKDVCNFTVAVNRNRKADGQPEADFFRVSAWGELGKNCHKYLTKGKKVLVTGPVSVSTYQAQNGESRGSLDIAFAEKVEFLSPAGENSAPQTTQAPTPAEAPTPVDTDELPF